MLTALTANPPLNSFHFLCHSIHISLSPLLPRIRKKKKASRHDAISLPPSHLLNNTVMLCSLFVFVTLHFLFDFFFSSFFECGRRRADFLCVLRDRRLVDLQAWISLYVQSDICCSICCHNFATKVYSL